MKKLLLLLLPGIALAQLQPTPLEVRRIYAINSSTTCIDNRSINYQNNYHSFIAVGTGSWSVQMQYSNTSCAGPWTSYGSAALVNQSSNPPIGYGNDGFNSYAYFISFAITGSGVSINYSSSQNYFLSTSIGSITFPITVPQGGTGIASATLNGVLLGNGTSPFQVTSAGSPYQVFTVPSGGAPGGWGQVNLGQSAAITGTLGVANGGTGVTAANGVGDSKVQLSSGTPMAGNCADFDSNGGTQDAGNPCAAFPSGTPTQYLQIEPNTGNNTTTRFASLPQVSASDYTFTISPSSSLTGGISNTVTMAFSPLGIAGTDVNHYVYISGGTGTAEAAKITGGTCTSGEQATCTIIFTPANNHSGAYTITSPTAGMQEAHNANPGACILTGAGTLQVYAPVWSNGNLCVQGALPNGTIIDSNSTNTSVFDIQNDWFYLSGLKLVQVGSATTGAYGVYTAGAGSSASVANANNGYLERMWFYGFYKDIKTDGGAGSINLDNLYANNAVSDGIESDETQGYWHAVVMTQNGGNGITFGLPSSGGGGGAPAFIGGIDGYNNHGWCIHAVTSFVVSGNYNFCNNDYDGEVYIGFAGIDLGAIVDMALQYAGDTVSWGTNTSAPALEIDTGVTYFSVNNIQIFAPEGNCITVNGSTAVIGIKNVTCLGPGVGAQSGNLFALLTASTSTDNQIIGNFFGGPVKTGGTGSQISDNIFSTNSATLPSLEVASGTSISIIGNQINQAGAAAALLVDAGVTYAATSNLYSGTVTNNGSAAANHWP
jgi:hypothetical protein